MSEDQQPSTEAPSQRGVSRVTWVLIATIALWMVLMVQFVSESRRNVSKGEPLPSFSVQRLVDGELVTTADLAGKPTIVFFWASWCGVCKASMPVLEEMLHKEGDRLRVLAVNVRDAAEHAEAFVQNKPNSLMEFVYDPTDQIDATFGLIGVPETFFVDANGVITSHLIGGVRSDRLTMDLGLLR